ncbi:MAG TPA: Rieske (2Fe-2S) protein [Vicinamibacterales bacterium]|jgi:Rieske Fe-S protein
MPDTTAPISRRQFCAGACQVASCATLATFVTACGGDGSPTGPSGGGGGGTVSNLAVVEGRLVNSRVQVTTAGTPLANVGGAARVESTAGLFLASRISDVAFTVIDGTCTHEGCAIGGTTDTQFVCGCHGSRYSKNGQVQQGPARSNLRQFANSFADGVLTITL